ncbi:Short-chain dehydrogenase/reductase SDR [Macleaya cordata]|uniref:Secoisolariciresinol dehydrogenase n=1 Tax=Macleaya cordata TaxID=56857 RepID=A0A200Q7M2_MACCD|nr:Short-chain dehydrogenase/reductase SDR [Macleaya cordata]
MGSSSLLSALARRLEGKVALITGGASGIGESTAKLFSQHGAKVIIADIQDELGQSVCKEIGPASASYIHCDVTDELQVQNAIDTTVANYGKLDIMFNNAGVLDKAKPSILDNEKSEFTRVLNVNVTGSFLGTKHAARVMIPARQGSIISTASISSIMAGAASHAYTCSKHAVLGLTKNAAVELGQFGIRVNCISPYGVVTPLAKQFIKMEDEELEKIMHAMANLKGVILKTEDVARAALYLGSDDSRYVSGLNLIIDGGFSTVNPSLGMFKYPDS